MNETIEVATTAKRVAIQGYEGSFHHLAAKAYYNEAVEIVPSRSFSDLVNNTVSPAESDAGIMAIENSIAGSILSNYSLLQESNLTIVGEVFLRIRQHLMALPGRTLDNIKEVHSHPMAIFQCRHFFKAYPHIKLVESEDTALSAKKIRDRQLPNIAAIASDLAAHLFDLPILERDIQVIANNYTRFLILSKHPDNGIADFNKATLYFRVGHGPGSLARALQGIAEAGVNLSKIQSVPVPENEWQYYFYVDMEFDDKEQFARALKTLAPITEGLKILGTYQKGKTI